MTTPLDHPTERLITTLSGLISQTLIQYDIEWFNIILSGLISQSLVQYDTEWFNIILSGSTPETLIHHDTERSNSAIAGRELVTQLLTCSKFNKRCRLPLIPILFCCYINIAIYILQYSSKKTTNDES